MSQKPSSTNVLLRCNNDVYNITGSRHEPLIRREERNEIRKKVQEFWDGKCSKSDFVGMAKGKEIGHRIADYVDEQTVQMLSSHFPCFHEVDKNGKKKPRSMGDVMDRIYRSSQSSQRKVRPKRVQWTAKPCGARKTTAIPGAWLYR